jgi:hypothetical protein
MEFKVTIKPDGKLITEVINRGSEHCTEIHRVTNAIAGRELSDEQIGPDCDRVEEVIR